MATAEEVIRIARSHIGYVEGPRNNETVFGTRRGAPLLAWCGSFVDCCLIDAGIKVTGIGGDDSEPSSVSTYQGWRNFKRLGRTSQDPRPGDLGFINPGPRGHVVLVTWVDGDKIHTVEGNTSPGNQGSQYNGGGCYARVRARSLFVGFGRPRYTTAPPPANVEVPALPVPKEDDDVADIYVENTDTPQGEKDTLGSVWVLTGTTCRQLTPKQWLHRVQHENVGPALPVKELQLVALTWGAGRTNVTPKQ